MALAGLRLGGQRQREVKVRARSVRESQPYGVSAKRAALLGCFDVLCRLEQLASYLYLPGTHPSFPEVRQATPSNSVNRRLLRKFLSANAWLEAAIQLRPWRSKNGCSRMPIAQT